MIEAAREALRLYTRFVDAEAVQRGRVLDPKADYKTANVEYVRSRAAFGDAMDALKVAVSRDGVRQAAEAGSAMARMLEVNGRKF